jgi:hypothetical protein
MYSIHQELAREHQADLMREAEKHRLALQARPKVDRAGRLTAFLMHVRRRRLRQQPVPAI